MHVENVLGLRILITGLYGNQQLIEGGVGGARTARSARQHALAIVCGAIILQLAQLASYR